MDLSLLKDIAIIFALSTFVNFIFTKIKVPTIIGYLLTGMIAGPFVLGIINAQDQIEIIAEIGIVLLMFAIGIEFSLNHLLKIRRVVFIGGGLQVFLTTALFMFIARFYDMSWGNALLIGFLTAGTSSTVAMKILQDRDELTSNYGRSVLGISLFQDIFMIPLLLFIPLLGGGLIDVRSEIVLLVIKAIFIIAFVYVGARWIMPKILHLVAMTKNKELFLMSILLICLSVALFTAELGMSLAFGAFLAGLMVSESEYSHDAFGNIIPFKDAFTSFFFVSIGMLLDMNFVFNNLTLVVGTVLLVIIGKMIIAGGTAFLLGHTFRGTVLVGIALSQVGEFSFILARVGLNFEIISVFYYQLFLAVAVITMSVSPFLVQLGKPLANVFLKLPLPKILVEGLFPLKQAKPPDLQNHLVLIGKDSRARNLSLMAKYINLPYIAIVFDPADVPKRQKRGETVIYGDALNEPILMKAHVETAEVVVVSIGDLLTSMAVVEKVRQINKHAYLLVRIKHVDDIEELYKLGADQVIPEEFETSIELFQRVLKKYLLPRRQIETIIARIRNDNYGIFREEDDSHKYSILKDIPNIEIMALKVNEHSYLVNKTPESLLLRTNYGITLLAIKRQELIIDNPKANTEFHKGDILYILGKPDKIANAIELFSKEGFGDLKG
jgi:monovalent cation:H+ antiporter-2, CPA2 family